MSFSLKHLRTYLISGCLITGDVTSDRWAGLLECRPEVSTLVRFPLFNTQIFQSESSQDSHVAGREGETHELSLLKDKFCFLHVVSSLVLQMTVWLLLEDLGPQFQGPRVESWLSLLSDAFHSYFATVPTTPLCTGPPHSPTLPPWPSNHWSPPLQL